MAVFIDINTFLDVRLSASFCMDDGALMTCRFLLLLGEGGGVVDVATVRPPITSIFNGKVRRGVCQGGEEAHCRDASA